MSKTESKIIGKDEEKGIEDLRREGKYEMVI